MKVEVAGLGSLSLTVPTVSVDVDDLRLSEIHSPLEHAYYLD